MIVTASSFDFTNGFHDTANAMATSIATSPPVPLVMTTPWYEDAGGRRRGVATVPGR